MKFTFDLGRALTSLGIIGACTAVCYWSQNDIPLLVALAGVWISWSVGRFKP